MYLPRCFLRRTPSAPQSVRSGSTRVELCQQKTPPRNVNRTASPARVRPDDIEGYDGVRPRVHQHLVIVIAMPASSHSSQLSMSMMLLGDIGTLLSPGALGRRVEQRASLQA